MGQNANIASPMNPRSFRIFLGQFPGQLPPNLSKSLLFSGAPDLAVFRFFFYSNTPLISSIYVHVHVNSGGSYYRNKVISNLIHNRSFNVKTATDTGRFWYLVVRRVPTHERRLSLSTSQPWWAVCYWSTVDGDWTWPLNVIIPSANIGSRSKNKIYKSCTRVRGDFAIFFFFLTIL